MSKKQLFEAFSEEEQEKYAAEAEQMYDPQIVKASQKKWKSYTKEDKQRIADEGNAAYEAIVAAIPLGASSPAGPGRSGTMAETHGLLLDSRTWSNWLA